MGRMLLLHRITLILACLFFVKQATSVAQDMNVEGTYTGWIKKQVQAHETLSNTLGQLSDKLNGHVGTSRDKITDAIAQLQQVIKSNQYSKCSKNILVWIKSLNGHDFAPCYNELVYNSTVIHLKQLQAIRQEIPAECKSKAAMADQNVMNNCVNETGNIIMKHLQEFEGGLKGYSDSIKLTSDNCVKVLKTKLDTFVKYVNAGCPDGQVKTKGKLKAKPSRSSRVPRSRE